MTTTSILQNKQQLVGIISVKDFIENTVIDFNYQLYPSEIQINKLVRRLSDNKNNSINFMDSFLVHLRDYNEKDISSNNLQYKNAYLLDGQHRYFALQKLLADEKEKWGNFKIPFVAMTELSYLEEVSLFYFHQAEGYSIDTKKAEKIILAKNSSLLSLNKNEIKAQEIVDELAKDKPWQGKIKVPGVKSKEGTISESSFASSLDPLLRNSFFKELKKEDQVLILKAYWQGLEKALPEAFKEKSVLQKTTGVRVLNHVLIKVMHLIRSDNKPLKDPLSYQEIMESALNKLEEISPDGTRVSGSDFWKSGASGAAGGYSSDAGRRILQAKINDLLPSIKV